MSVRVRFAPSPTGSLHIGSARTALFNWLFARHEKGTFILRVEDTDAKRSGAQYVEGILEQLKWLGLDWDEGPYFQSKRFEIYDDFVKKLQHQGKAYEDQGAVRFRTPRAKVVFHDVLHGETEFDFSILPDFEDLVLLKSDGTPTYNFACVVDDAAMKITHVIRGDDHISNTPKQVVLYEALGITPPKFIHIPLILGEEGGRLSKRTGATSIGEFRELGYLPEAIVNYLVLLGWSPKNNREVVTLDEMIQEFSVERVNKNAAKFNTEKLDWINLQYMKKADPDRLAKLVVPILEKEELDTKRFSHEQLKQFMRVFQSRLYTLKDFCAMGRFLFIDSVAYEGEAAQELLTTPSVYFKDLGERFGNLASFEPSVIQETAGAYIQEHHIPPKSLLHPLRIALTGSTVSPGIYDLLSVAGKELTIKRLSQASEFIEQSGVSDPH